MIITTREKELLVLIALGYTNEEIAYRMLYSKATVKRGIDGLMNKLGVRTRAQLAIYACLCYVPSEEELRIMVGQL